VPKTVKITALDDKGRGLGEGLSYPFAYPGDEIAGEIANKRKKTGRLVSLISGSPDRQTPPCPHFGRCGGCPWQGLKYEAQLRLKQARVESLFGECRSIIPSPDLYYYRNRMDYAFGPDHSLGLKAEGNRIINIEKCLLMSEASNTVMAALRHFVQSANLDIYYQRTGLMRHAVIREGKNIDNLIVNILTSDQGAFPLAELWRELKEKTAGVSWGINLSLADRSYGELRQTLGRDHYREVLGGLHYQVPVQSFFQTNIKAAENILTTVKSLIAADGAETLLDLYSGTGSIGLYLSRSVKKVIGIEEDKTAVALSLRNAELNSIGNFSAVAGRAEDVLPGFREKADLVVVDPPRPGLHKKVLQKLGELKAPQIIYVSCNPLTQKNDVEVLKTFGYKIEVCQPLDLFPHTPHIENVISLRL